MSSCMTLKLDIMNYQINYISFSKFNYYETKEMFCSNFSNVNAFCKQILEMQKWYLKFNALHVALDGVISNVT